MNRIKNFQNNKISLIRNLFVLLLFLIINLSFGTRLVNAQEIIPVSGGVAKGSGGSASFTLGQLTSGIHRSSGGSATEGMQQAYEISVLTNINEKHETDIAIITFPNPVKDVLSLQVSMTILDDLNFRMYDVTGKLIDQGKVSGELTEINMQECVPSIYYFHLMQEEKVIKSFKIIKY